MRPPLHFDADGPTRFRQMRALFARHSRLKVRYALPVQTERGRDDDDGQTADPRDERERRLTEDA